MFGILKVNGFVIDKGFYSVEAIKELEEVGFIFEVIRKERG